MTDTETQAYPVASPLVELKNKENPDAENIMPGTGRTKKTWKTEEKFCQGVRFRGLNIRRILIDYLLNLNFLGEKIKPSVLILEDHTCITTSPEYTPGNLVKRSKVEASNLILNNRSHVLLEGDLRRINVFWPIFILIQKRQTLFTMDLSFRFM